MWHSDHLIVCPTDDSHARPLFMSVCKHTTRRVARISRWQNGAEVGVSANTPAAAKANISIFNTAAWPTRTTVSVCMTNRSLALVHRGDLYLVALRSRCCNACFTFLHQSLPGCSLTTVSVECEMRKEGTEPEPWEKRAVRGWEQTEVTGF